MDAIITWLTVMEYIYVQYLSALLVFDWVHVDQWQNCARIKLTLLFR